LKKKFLIVALLTSVIILCFIGTAMHAQALSGDLNGDTSVDIYDALELIAVFGLEEGQTGWNPDADLNVDTVIDIFDAILLASNFGMETV